MAADERVSSPTQSAAILVDELYKFRDHFAENVGLEGAGNKEVEVEKKMKDCLKAFEKHQGDIKNKAVLQLLRGRILNVVAKYSQDAEEALSKAVKLDPKLVEAWNHLGECYWKKEDVSAAKNCFTGALNHSKNKVSLRNLSMVLRQLSGPPVEKVKLIEESVQRAKEAVQLDIADGTSWLILGNAYLCQFFSTGQNPKILKQCMQAYGQAEKDPVAKGNPDLYFNRSMAFKFQENYSLALEGFSTAAMLDPSWDEAKAKEGELLTYLKGVQEMVETKGKSKQKKVDSLLRSIADKDLGPLLTGQFTNKAGKSMTVTKSHLKDLLMKTNEAKVALGVVVCNVHTNDLVPFTFCIMDEEGTCVAVNVYNLAQGAGMKIGDRVAIPEPQVKKVKIMHKGSEMCFTSIYVDTPRMLVVNGRPLTKENEVMAVLSVSAVSE